MEWLFGADEAMAHLPAEDRIGTALGVLDFIAKDCGASCAACVGQRVKAMAGGEIPQVTERVGGAR